MSKRKPIAVVINWFGPYSYRGAIHAARDDGYTDGLYLAIGRQKFDKKDRVQYVGVSNNLYKRIKPIHPTLKLIDQKLILWLGEVASTGIPGKQIAGKSPALEMAEWAHVYFIDPILNDKKRMNPPSSPVTVINRWWHSDYETPWKRKPHADWPDMIDYWGKEFGARLVHLRRTRGSIKTCFPEDF
ncbi:MAG TPA: hypothetical protein ENH10_10380 [Bacteroidetes bacterium]|nr:hypothetical protein BMS3Bbin04_01185 [bacterium BMS3Bbin04]HDO66413.1 hypothetical protein [Bacteroidota bacterium]HEX05538.1 hypothetical protein [Bacteroidota bacterium]